MAKRIGFEQVTNPDICFAFIVADEDEKKVIELVSKGLSAWGNPSAVAQGEFLPDFDSEDAGWIGCAGYSEPATELLDKAGINYTMIDIDCDNETGHLNDKELEDSIDWIAV